MSNELIATQLLLSLLDRAMAASNLIAAAQAEGRKITDEEISTLRLADDAARAALQAEIDAQGG